MTRLQAGVIGLGNMGGGVAMELSLLMPDKCQGLILLNSLKYDGLPGDKVDTIQELSEKYPDYQNLKCSGSEP